MKQKVLLFLWKQCTRLVGTTEQDGSDKSSGQKILQNQMSALNKNLDSLQKQVENLYKELLLLVMQIGSFLIKMVSRILINSHTIEQVLGGLTFPKETEIRTIFKVLAM